MSLLGNAVGASAGINMANKKGLKPRVDKSSIVATVIMILLFLAFLAAFIYGIINLNVEFIVMPGITLCALGYLLCICHTLQSPKNYDIKFHADEHSPEFIIYYKKKKVNFLFVVDAEGKIAFANNDHKEHCFSYADGSKMRTITKYRIANYLTRWLVVNDLISNSVTVVAS